SSRRRHTRSYGDWSSDVCSSDLRSKAAGALEVVHAVTIGLIICRVVENQAAEIPEQRGRRAEAAAVDWLPYPDVRAGQERRARRSEERRVGKEWRGGGWGCGGRE